MKIAVRDAALAAVIAAVLAIPIFGLKIELVGRAVRVDPDAWPILIAALGVFLLHLSKPLALRPLHRFRQFFPRHLDRPELSVKQQRIVWALALIAMLILPFLVQRGTLTTLTMALTYIVLGLGLNITVGFAGLLDLGYIAFYAVGAYTFALLNHYFGLSFWTCLPLSIVMAAAFGLIIGFPVLRLRGDYLAIVTLGFSEIIRRLLDNFGSITGGPTGLTGLDKPTVLGLEMARKASTEGATTVHQFLGLKYQGIHMEYYLYFLILVFALFTFYFTGRLLFMPIGRAWEALRDDEIACRSVGISPTWIKLSAFMLSAMLAGLAGCFFAARQGMVSPNSFLFSESALILSIVVLGGMGSRVGIVLAAVILTLLPELARGFSEYRMLIFGAVMVLMMAWRPQGLLPARRRHLELP